MSLDIRLPPVALRPEYGPLLLLLADAGSDATRRAMLREACRLDRYILAYLLGYDDDAHRWDAWHLWAIRERIPQLRAVPGLQSAWFCPRGTYKTALEEVDVTWSALHEPDKSFGVGSWKLDVATMITRAVKRNLEHPAIAWLYPDVVWPVGKERAVWREDEMTVRRSKTAAKDSTVWAFALEAPATARHSDRLYLDDVVERRNTATEHQLLKVAQTMRDIRSLRVGPESQIEVRGTFWDPEDWYQTAIVGNPVWVVERHPAIAEAGNPVGAEIGAALFPSAKPLVVLDADRAQMGTYHFGCQMMLEVASAADAVFNRTDVLRYFTPDDMPRRFSSYMVLDLANEDPEDEDPDYTAMGLFLAAPPGPAYNIYIRDGRAQQRWSWPNVAATAFDWHEQWGCSLYVEEVGAFRAFERSLLHEAERRGYMIPHVRLQRDPGSGGKVKNRIRELEPWYERHRVLTRDPGLVEPEARVFFELYERQALRWPRVRHDDVLEIVSDATRVCVPPPEVHVVAEALRSARQTVARVR